MRKLKIGVLLLIFSLVIIGCTSNNELNDESIKIGMSPEEVINIENTNGNIDYSEQFNENVAEVNFDNISKFGESASISYRFDNMVNLSNYIQYDKGKITGDLSEDEYTELYNKHININIEFGEYKLVGSICQFESMNNEAKNEIIKSLSDRYGDFYDAGRGYYWFSDHSTVYFLNLENPILYEFMNVEGAKYLEQKD